MGLIENQKYQGYIVAALIALSCFLTYYFENIIVTNQIYTHFYYIPIILSCIWWKRRGLYVTLALLLILTFGQNMYFRSELAPEDFIRGVMLAFISLITVVMSEALTRAREQLKASERRYRTIFETTGTGMAIIEADTTISLVNSEFVRLSGFAKDEIENKMSWKNFVAGIYSERMSTYHRNRRIDPDSAPKHYEIEFIARDREPMDVLLTIDMIADTKTSVASFSDITELKRTLKRQKELQSELSAALAKVLGGFIPICANCKKIRDDENNWVQIESFISGKTAADFSHGICPECAKKLYSEFLPDDFGKDTANRSKQMKAIEFGGRRDGHACSNENRGE